jgi:hypothetical protein
VTITYRRDDWFNNLKKFQLNLLDITNPITIKSKSRNYSP